ncbi:Uncharacterised protein [Enterobacter cloacae]|nr:Uncharacterised protein [Enterobacter cloacae]
MRVFIIVVTELALNQPTISFFFGPGCRVREFDDITFRKLASHLIFHVFFEATHNQIFIGKIGVFILFRISNGRRVEHIHQAGKTFSLTVMRRGREHNQRIAASGKQFCQFAAQGAGPTFSDVMRFIDNNNIPPGIFQVVAIFDVLFQSIDGDNGLIEIVKRVVVGWDTVTHLL